MRGPTIGDWRESEWRADAEMRRRRRAELAAAVVFAPVVAALVWVMLFVV